MVQETPVIILCGPTASGKTAAGLRMAETIGAEIVSADSGQIYRGMDIGTAKPTPEERRRIPFHLIDVLDPDQKFSAADFRRRALETIEGIQMRRKQALLVGGTGLYLRALEEGLFDGPSADSAMRHELEERIRLEGVESLHRELEQVDPEAAKTIPSRNRQRLIRALEVFRLTGRPISEFWKEHGREDRAPTFVKFGLSTSKEELHRRIDQRVEEMIKQGLLAETRGLLEKWGPKAPGLSLIGYKEIVSHLLKKISLEESIRLIKTHTRQYAKRQQTWFKKVKDIQWFSEPNALIQHLTKNR